MTSYLVIYEQADNGDWGAYLPDLPGVIAGGDTKEEVEALIEEGVRLYFEHARQQGDADVPAAVTQAGIVTV